MKRRHEASRVVEGRVVKSKVGVDVLAALWKLNIRTEAFKGVEYVCDLSKKILIVKNTRVVRFVISATVPYDRFVSANLGISIRRVAPSLFSFGH